MKHGICWFISSALILPAMSLAAGTGAPARAVSPEALKAEIESLRPAKQVWREIAWQSCPLEALKEAREKHRPVLAWVFLGNPTEERC